MVQERIRKFVPGTNQGRLFLKVIGSLAVLSAAGHLFLGAGFAAVIFCTAAIFLSLLPLAYCGPLNIAAVLVALAGFRYVGFPLIAKLVMYQPLDSFLLDPKGSFAVVLAGILGYDIAVFISTIIPSGRPLLTPVSNSAALGRISFLAAVVGIIANMIVAMRVGNTYTGVTVAEFFTPFLHLALITAIARVALASKHKRSVDGWVIVILILEVALGMVRNSRMVLLETLLCFMVTVSSFEYKIRWRQFGFIAAFIAIMIVFISPVFLYVREFREDLSWAQRIKTTVNAFSKWPETVSAYLETEDDPTQPGWFLNYYGRPENVLERMSNINHVDVLKAGIDTCGKVGATDISDGIERAIPRLLAPDKPRGYSTGDWLYRHIGVQNFLGNYSTTALIGNGYAAFGWLGAFFYPAVLGLLWLALVKKISGFDLRANIWTIYLLLRIHNQFVEGSSGAYFVYILRILPQDFILLYLIKVVGEGRFLSSWNRIRAART